MLYNFKNKDIEIYLGNEKFIDFTWVLVGGNKKLYYSSALKPFKEDPRRSLLTPEKAKR